jgi:PKD repeat protein
MFRIIHLHILLLLGTCVIAQNSTCGGRDCGQNQVRLVYRGGESVCQDAGFSLTNLSEAGLDSIVIDWGDGQTETIGSKERPSHRYRSLIAPCASAVERTIRYRGYKSCAAGSSCSEGSLTLRVDPPPVADFSARSEVCTGTLVTFFEEACNEALDSYRWNFGDGTTSTGATPTHTFTAPGEYEVTLTVSGKTGGCTTATDRASRRVTVVEEPQTDFVIGDTSLVNCLGTIYTFANRSSGGTQISWSISNPENWSYTERGMGAGSDSIAVQFNAVGEYLVRLNGQNACGSERKDVFIRVRSAPVLELAPIPRGCDSVVIASRQLDYQIGGEFRELFWVFTQGPKRDTLYGDDFGTYTYLTDGSLDLNVVSVCGTLTRSVPITVQVPEQAVLISPSTFCRTSGSTVLTTDLPGGSWAGPGVTDSESGLFQPGEVGPGTTEVTYTLQNGVCLVDTSYRLDIIEGAEVSVVDTNLCSNDVAVQLVARPEGGIWAGSGIRDPATGLFDPASTGPGRYRIDYTYTDPNGCTNQQSAQVTVVPPPAISGLDSVVVCAIDAEVNLQNLARLSANDTTGSFSFTRNGNAVAGGIINPVTDFSGPGTYAVDYHYRARGCEVSGTVVVLIPADTQVRIDGPPTVCLSDQLVKLSANLPGGIWSGPGINPLTGAITTRSAGAGAHTYRYTFASGQACEQTQQVTLRIEDAATGIDAGPDQLVCADSVATLTLTGASPVGGSWSGPALTDSIVDLGRLPPDSAYLYTYRFTTPSGCSAEANRTIVYGRSPEPAFAGPDSVCVNEPFTLTPSASNVSYRYSFGDGSESTEPEPTYRYTEGDRVAEQSLTVRTAFGCVATARRSVAVIGLPMAEFVLDSTAGCAPFMVELADPGIGALRSYYLLGADTVELANSRSLIINSLSRDTTVRVTLVNENRCGTARKTEMITVRPTPEADFAVVDGRGCSPFVPNIVNTSFGNATSFTWDFGNGQTVRGQDPEIPAFENSTDTLRYYPIRLTARNECGVDTFEDRIAVLPPDIRAVIDLDTPSGCAPLTVRPRSRSTRIASVDWTVLNEAGRQVATASGDTSEFTLAAAGRYRIVLRADACGMSTDTVVVTVAESPPVALLFPDAACAGVPTQLSYRAEGLTNIFWDFGDVGSSDRADPSVTFPTGGNYPVAFTAFEPTTGCELHIDTSLTAVPPPQASFSMPPPVVCQPYRLQLTARNTEATRYRWYLNNEPVRTTGRRLDTLLSETGVYSVSLVAANRDLCRDSLFVPEVVEVEPQPVAAFSALVNQDVGRGGDVSFENLSTGAFSYRWQFGDSTTSRNRAPVHYYRGSGPYSVQLIATATYAGGFSCSDTTARVVRPEGLGRFYVPTALSPDSGTPEVRLWGAKGNDVSAYTLEVFSPYGQRIFFTDEVEDGQPAGRWDGMLPDGETPAMLGTYTWRARVSFVDGTTDNQLGTVTLIR